MTYDLILRGGRVIDPSQKLDAVPTSPSLAARSPRWAPSWRAAPATMCATWRAHRHPG